MEPKTKNWLEKQKNIPSFAVISGADWFWQRERWICKHVELLIFWLVNLRVSPL